MLKDANIQSSYSDEEDNISEDFLIPALENSITYSRVAGHFSSSVYEICYEALETFISNGKKANVKYPQIRLLVSHKLRSIDVSQADEAYVDRIKKNIEEDITFDINEFLTDDNRLETLKLFSYLIKHRILEIKVGVIKAELREHKNQYLHEKTGIFFDGVDNAVFRGGVNESRSGFANFDGFDVSRSWTNSLDSIEQIHKNRRIFDNLWGNNSKKLDVYNLPTAVKKKLIESSATDLEFKSEIKKRKSSGKKYLEGIEPMDHQERALRVWKKNKYKAVLKYCTGSGKTIIAIMAISKMLLLKKNALVIVPSNTLLEQWADEVYEHLGAQVNILKCNGDNDWKERLRYAVTSTQTPYVIIATIQTASNKPFKDRCSEPDKLFLIVDECHSLWPPVFNTVLSDIPWDPNGPRLALSATPEDTSFAPTASETDVNENELFELDGDQERGSINPIEFFGGNLKNGEYLPNDIFTIKHAINENILSHYDYYVEEVILTRDEMDDYKKYSERIARAMDKKKRFQDNSKLQLAINARNRVIKIAANKRYKCLQILQSKERDEHFLDIKNQHWLIYVGPGRTDEISEIQHVHNFLANELGVTQPIYLYDGTVKGKDKRGAILDNFRLGGGIVLACQMLDEGVDLPELSRAIVMASSENTRQFIQRRGRLLRIDKRHIDSKPSKSLIWDMLVMPNIALLEDPSEIESYERFIKAECKRAIEFCDDADNADYMKSCIASIERRYLNLL
jgi:superfamily II DNA or RNA helicase